MYLENRVVKEKITKILELIESERCWSRFRTSLMEDVREIFDTVQELILGCSNAVLMILGCSNGCFFGQIGLWLKSRLTSWFL